MLTGHAELFAWMLSYDCMMGAAVVLTGRYTLTTAI